MVGPFRIPTQNKYDRVVGRNPTDIGRLYCVWNEEFTRKDSGGGIDISNGVGLVN